MDDRILTNDLGNVYSSIAPDVIEGGKQLEKLILRTIDKQVLELYYHYLQYVKHNNE